MAPTAFRQRRRPRPGLCAALALLAVLAGPAAAETAAASGLSYQLEAGIQAAGERRLFWTLADHFASDARFNSDRVWWEFYVKPGLRLRQPLERGAEFYGGLSMVGSGTLRHDAFDTGNTGRASLEDAFLGLRWPLADAATQLDLSVGAQSYSLGTGMLIANGGSNGFSRGALKLGPRKAFEMSAIARLKHRDWSAEAFLLDPNESPDNDSGNRLVGATLGYKPSTEQFIGIAYGEVTRSQAPYPQAPPGGEGIPSIIEGARRGLSFTYGFARWPLLRSADGLLWLGLDAAVEHHKRIDLRAWGGRVELGYAFQAVAGKPKVSYNYQTFSGDDPATPRLERFDPLFYEGSPGAWATGSKASMVFINTNVRAHQLTIEWTATPRDLLALYVAHLRANELRSPLQFGQATRLDFADGVPKLISGVTHAHLSDDIFSSTRACSMPSAT